MDTNGLFHTLENVEFYDIETSNYFRMVAVFTEDGMPIVQIEKI